jgi:uncharacterized protein with ParB-like and HNH nuclease domain
VIANPLKVRELLDEILGGKVVLPEIQRAYVWKGPQVAKLMDSLYNEYRSFAFERHGWPRPPDRSAPCVSKGTTKGGRSVSP